MTTVDRTYRRVLGRVGLDPATQAALDAMQAQIDTLAAGADYFSIFDPKYEGPSGPAGAGNVNADMYALQAAIDDMASGSPPDTNGKPKLLKGRGGKRLIMNATVEYPAGAGFTGGRGSSGVMGRPMEIVWNGTAGGFLFNDVKVGDRINNQIVEDIVFREGTTRPGKFWEMGDETTNPVSGVDFGTRFWNVHFYNFDDVAVDVRFAPTNFFAHLWRADNFPGAVWRFAVNNASSHVTMGWFTVDNGGTSGGGYIAHLDGASAGSNKNVKFHLHDGKIEINHAVNGQKALVLATMDPTATQKLMHRINLSDITIALGSGISGDYSIVKARRTDDVATEMIEVYAEKMKHTPGSAGRLIDGVIDPNSLGSSYTGSASNWSYTPRGFGFTSPTAEAAMSDYQETVRFRDLLVGGGYDMTAGLGAAGGRGTLRIGRAMADPSGTPGVWVIWQDASGNLVGRSPSGTLRTIALA